MTLPVLRNAGEAVHLLVDSTGLKLFGEGEWKVRKHGYARRRSWRKVHLGMDAGTEQVCAVLMMHRDVDDPSVLPELLAQIPQGTKIEVVIGDGAYDTMAARVAIARRGALAVIPPVEGAVHWPASQAGGARAQRGHRPYCPKRQAGLERQWRLPPLLFGGEPNVPHSKC